jgi:hypothetical protein
MAVRVQVIVQVIVGRSRYRGEKEQASSLK